MSIDKIKETPVSIIQYSVQNTVFELTPFQTISIMTLMKVGFIAGLFYLTALVSVKMKLHCHHVF